MCGHRLAKGAGPYAGQRGSGVVPTAGGGRRKMATHDGTGSCLTCEVWADIGREAKDASDAFLVVEDDCRFWSKATTEVPGA